MQRAMCALLLGGVIAGRPGSAGADEPISVDWYVALVLRSHPAAARAAGMEAAADAERKTLRIFPDPMFEYSRGKGRSTDGTDESARETGYALSQVLPWPGTFSAGARAGDQAAAAGRAAAESVRWDLAVTARQTFARFEAARALVDVVTSAEGDALTLRDLVARRAELGESRESDRIKAEVEWLRQQRNLAAATREAGAAEAALRALAVERLPVPLSIGPTVHPPLPPQDDEALSAIMLERNPRARELRAEAERRNELLSAARSERMPDLEVTAFQENEIDREGEGFTFGIRLPLWNANRGVVARASSAAAVARAEVDSVRIALTTDLKGRLSDLQIAAEQARLLDEDLLPASQRSVDLVRFSYEEGEASLLDLLDAQRTYRDTQRETIAAHLALAQALAEVQRLVGPDYDPWRQP
jgi:cobalt-zinc-cadmium efflux system outer membrane protein